MIPIHKIIGRLSNQMFETAKELDAKDGKLFVEIIDEIEEKVKAIRMVRAKK